MTVVTGPLWPACDLLIEGVPVICTLTGRFVVAEAALIITGVLPLVVALLGARFFLGRMVVEGEVYVVEGDIEVEEEDDELEDELEDEEDDEELEDDELVLFATRIPFLRGLPEPLLLLLLLLLMLLEMGVTLSATSLPLGLTTRPPAELSEDSSEEGLLKFQIPVP